MLNKRTLFCAASVLSLFFYGSQVCAAPEEAPNLPENLPINELQVLGTHNSYSIGVDPRVRALISSRLPNIQDIVGKMPELKRREFLLAHPNPVNFSEALSYSHPSLKEQLDLGVRALEIDVNADPEGGAYADPAAYRLLKKQRIKNLLPFNSDALKEPGIKVLHMPNIDFRSSCPTFRLCLEQMKAWSDAHPRHIPIFVMIEAKVEALNILPNSSKVPPFTDATYQEIDHTILDVLGREAVITPDDVKGNYPTLEQTVLHHAWPSLKQARGKFIFQLMTATGVDGASAYLNGHPDLIGRVAFLDSQPGRPYAAFILDDNALARGKEIREEVQKGYIVRTRADIETYEAKINDPTRANAAFATGAQIISTDYEKSGNAYHTPYVVTLPGHTVARIAPR